MELKSTAFQANQMVPKKYTCEGEDTSPPLKWTDPPEGTKSFVLISDDPDAPAKTWVHWVIYNVPANVREFKEGMPKKDTLGNGERQGKNDFGRIGYGGPCPPPGTPHRYYFKLYALDAALNIGAGATKQQVEEAMKGHVLGSAELVGKYKR